MGADPDPAVVPEAALASVVRAVLLATAAALAVATPLAHGTHLAGVSFAVFAPTAAVLALGAFGTVLARGLRGVGPGLRAGRREALTLGGLCAATGLLLLLVQHATSDDSSYLPPVVRCLAHPDRVPGYYDFLWVGDPDPGSPRWALPVAFDFLEGVFSRYTGVPLVTTRYLVAPPFLAAMVPAAWFLLISRAGFGTRAAVAGTLLGGAVLLLLRDLSGAPGSVFVLRVYQAKFFCAAVLLPLFAAEALHFLRAPTAGRWGILAAIATACAGCALSSLLLVCLLAPAIALAAVAADTAWWRRAAWILPAVAYPLLVAAWIHGDARAGLSPDSAANMLHERSYADQLLLVYGGAITPWATLAGILATALSLDGQPRRFALGWTAAVLALYLNPLVAPFVIENVASNIYWRIPYLLPLPLLLGAPVAAWVARRDAAGIRNATLPVTAAAGLLLLLQVPFESAGVYRDLQLVRPLPDPDRCLNREVAADARWIVSRAPPGPLLAPQYLSTIVTIVDPDHPPLVHWPEPVRFWMERAGRKEEAELRLLAGRGLERGGERGAHAVLELIRRRPEVRSVAACPEALGGSLEAGLLSAGYEPAGTGPFGVRLFVRKQRPR